MSQYADAMQYERIIGYFTRLKNRYRLVYCSFTKSYKLNIKENNGQYCSEKYISFELGKFIKNKYNLHT